jgi:glycosyltransferase involved in cell wall biosynthesis
MPKISIITTTYKHEKFIAQTIDSILSQTFTEWELLIGDDSPDDSTWDVIQKYVTLYPGKIYAWHHMPNRGIVCNMNFLISHASPISEYIAFLE